MAKKEKFSLNDRIKFYNNKLHSCSDKAKKAHMFGYLDAATLGSIDSSSFTSPKERDSYYKGVKRGQKALAKASSLKW